MLTNDIFKARAFRLALGFAIAISAATVASFGLIYLQVSTSDVERVGAVLVDEAAKSDADSEGRLRQALELRLTRDIRRLDYVALFEPGGAMAFGNVAAMPAIPVDARAHVVRERLSPDWDASAPSLFVARPRPDGSVLLLGRSLRDAYEVQKLVLRALAVALAPTVFLILTIGALFARRASQRLERVHGAILRIMKGELDSRLPVLDEGDDVDSVARAVNLMLDEIGRLLDQLKSVGDNIAHDLRTPLMVARAKMERALEEDAGAPSAIRASLVQVDKASVTISAILRISAIENGVREKRLAALDLGQICTDVFDFYEPLAQAKSIAMSLNVEGSVPMLGDEDLMREAISNLVDNAVKYTPSGGAIRVEARSIGSLPRAAVSDNGHGVPPYERAKIFRRFCTGEQGEMAGGHGLGLSIAETIANMHGFELTVEDNNPGARFVLQAKAKLSLGVEPKAA